MNHPTTPSTTPPTRQPPPLVVGEVIHFTDDHVHTIQSHVGAVGAPALRLSSSKELVPNTEKTGHIVFLKDYTAGKTSCTIKDAHGRFSRALCN